MSLQLKSSDQALLGPERRGDTLRLRPERVGAEQKDLEVYKGLSFQTPSLPFLSTLIHPPTEDAQDRSAGQE